MWAVFPCVPHLLHCPSVLAAAVLNEIASAWPPSVRRSIAAWKRHILTQLFWAQVAKWLWRLWFMIKWNVLKWTQNHPNWSKLRRSFMANPWFWAKNGSNLLFSWFVLLGLPRHVCWLQVSPRQPTCGQEEVNAFNSEFIDTRFSCSPSSWHWALLPYQAM